ncbi:BamA/OMP85 family outer membrane protein [Roseimaritima multifibrata]|nr:BamA/TamA family outer membrane protein [Roseimaritima multifibrata]
MRTASMSLPCRPISSRLVVWGASCFGLLVLATGCSQLPQSKSPAPFTNSVGSSGQVSPATDLVAQVGTPGVVQPTVGGQTVASGQAVQRPADPSVGIVRAQGGGYATPPSYQSGDTLPPPQPYNGAPYNGPPVSAVPEAAGTVFADPAFHGTDFAPPPPMPYAPQENVADLYINGAPGRTGKIMIGGAVNSDAGVTGQFTIDERNFDIRRWPTSFQDMFSGTAFRGDGQTFRLEAAPGTEYQRYSVQFGEPNLFDTNVSMNLSGFLYNRRFQDWDEERIGARLALGYRLTSDLSMSAGLQGQSVELSDPLIPIPEITDYVGQHDLFAGQFKLTHDTRDSPFGASQGHMLEWSFEQTFGDYVYPKAEIDYRRYFLVRQRADGSGKHTLTFGTQFGVSGNETPVFENFFAGGYATLRGFEFRGASPMISGAQVGGRFSWISSVEYMAPITADDAFRAVAFVDFGTVERDFDINADNFRVAPGFGIRAAIPAMGPAPLAFDFAFPVAYAETDERQVFSFYMSAAR